jgi:hypothetical protein
MVTEKDKKEVDYSLLSAEELLEKTKHQRIKYSEGSSFINVRTKIINHSLKNDAAWIEAQPLFENRIESTELPDDTRAVFDKYQPFLREIFDLRRKAYLAFKAGAEKEPYSKEATKKIMELDINERNDLLPLIVLVRDVFNIAPPQKGPRSKS